MIEIERGRGIGSDDSVTIEDVEKFGRRNRKLVQGKSKAQLQSELEKKDYELRELQQDMDNLVGEAEMLAKAAVEGKLDTRGDVTKFKGGSAKIVQGVNDTLDAVIGPLNVAAEYVDRISKGDIPDEITDEYKGDFNEVKNNLNQAIKAINGLTAEAGMLAEAAVEGKLDTRGDASKFGGDFANIVQGVNDTLDGVIGPLNVAAEYVDRISKGDIPEEITDEYKGDFNEIKNNLNQAIKAINGLVAEAGMLNEAAVGGKLDTRGDASKFGGAFANIVQGVNETLDAVIGPLNVAAEYVDRISKGDIPDEITDEYKGDFNEIKNNLNQAIKAINGLTAEAGMLAEAAVEGKLDTRGDASKFGGDFAKIVQGVNDTLDGVIGPLNVAAEYVDRISKGDIPEEITDEYKGDFNEIKNNLNQAIKAINGLTAEAGMLAEAAVEGKLDTRGDASKFSGDFAKIVQGVNDTLDGVIGPLNVAAEYVDRISKGDIPEEITDEYKGDFNEIKNNLNNAIKAINGLVAEAGMLNEAAVGGKLDTRGDVSKFSGDFAKIVQGVNETLDGVIGPLNVAAEYVDRISKGDIPEEITDEYKGDFNEIKNNLNNAIKAINGLVAEAGMLNEAAVEGRLETRGDASKFGGDFAKIVQGVNETLDGVIGPLNVAAEYVDRISKGDIPEEITDEYKGDFNEIKNNLNNAIKAINGLVSEAGMLAEAAIEGKLDTRGDVGKFSGDFAKIVQGVNETLDGVIGPLNVAAEYVDRISKGDIPEEITDEYKGDFNEIKNNLNNAIKAINGLVAEAGMLNEAAIEGKLDTRGDVSKFGGDFAKIVQGVNETLDGVIGPLNVAAEYVDRISKGDIPEEITDEYKGDFNEIKNNLNNAIKAINGLVSEAGMLNEAAVEGRLETHGDASKFGGDFAKIVQGVNDTLDGVIGPLNVAADYVDRISKGDIPEEITDEYKGDFNEIKNNLNQAIKAISGLVAEAGMLAEAAVEGKLDTRGDVNKFQGDFAKIVQGVNKMVDAVVEPVREVMRVCNALAGGDLSERIEIEAKGEFLELAESLNMATDNLSDLVAELKGTVQNVASIGKESASSVEQVNSGMQQISSASQQIAKGAQETSSTVNDAAKEVKETNAVLQQVQSNAEEANKFAVESAESAKEMNEMAMKSSEGMKEIQEAIGDTVTIIKSLNSSLEQVGKTTEVIEGIAEQTNLLALNAAIEAARAGEHGRGFAVVAEEVRKLAENSKQSTGDIDTMIKNLQEEMEKAVKATDSITQRAEVGREDLEKAVAGVEKTAGMIDDIKNRMEQITEGARKGAESIGNVSKGVDEIASSSEQAASSSEESSSAVEQQTAAAEQLSGGIQKLSEISDQATQMIAKFKLKVGSSGEGKSNKKDIASSAAAE